MIILIAIISLYLSIQYRQQRVMLLLKKISTLIRSSSVPINQSIHPIDEFSLDPPDENPLGHTSDKHNQLIGNQDSDHSWVFTRIPLNSLLFGICSLQSAPGWSSSVNK